MIRFFLLSVVLIMASSCYADMPGTNTGRVDPHYFYQSGTVVSSSAPMTTATGTSKTATSDAIDIRASEQHSIHIEWTCTGTAADATVQLLGCDTSSGTFRAFSPAISRTLTGTSENAIYAVNIPVCKFVKAYLTGDTNGTIAINKLVLNAW